MKLTTRSRYGTRMMLDIALHCQDGPVRIQDIASRQGVSAKYLEKLIRKLKDGGFIKSKRGPRGGHSLALPANDITIGSVVRALEGDDSLVECRSEGKGCDRMDVCLTRGLWQDAAEAMYARLNVVTLADLISDAVQCDRTPFAAPKSG
ncbi:MULTISPECIES: Rrf2 family transcriptional regulator [unclassified Pseudodesulfovibrio]|uniref:RrF2 family transcriptional regulator n=1 Tax=unclassified Pseudodesulfovibrio TaxID=2661612 RepID=UPI000FEBA3FB|nr:MULTISPECIES: Rrf2 family transcriptional regulator [unclassified Pseudodesulfovibrio]MCJ2164874.1 Rrf2 family transcriptional regulator [Pseudodesulfovibrio sp. S3-i]RWU03758.1 Rrf2 family transcriptional regulator [Pseudodesulfovibrio sp. S3]